MATVYFTQNKVIGYKTADIGPATDPPGADASLNFDPDPNQVLLAILAHEPARLTLTIDKTGLLLDGNPFTINGDGPNEVRRKRVRVLLAKARNNPPLTTAELTEMMLVLAKRIGDLDQF